MSDESILEPVTVDPPRLPRPVIMRQRWCDLVYLHWAIRPDWVSPLMPPGTVPDLHEGSTYVGLVPFRMVGAGFAGGPAVPWAGSFHEMNVRLYSVDRTGRRGVVFCSLDANRLVVVLGARTVLGLPYRWSRIHHHERRTDDGPEHEYGTSTRWPGPAGHVSRLTVRDLGSAARAGDTLAHFVSARWGLHVQRYGRTWYLPVAHEPVPLHRAHLVHLDDQLVAASGLPGVADRPPDHVLFSPGVQVRFGRPVDARTPRPR